MKLTLVMTDEEIKEILSVSLENNTHYRVSDVSLARRRSGEFEATYTVVEALGAFDEEWAEIKKLSRDDPRREEYMQRKTGL